MSNPIQIIDYKDVPDSYIKQRYNHSDCKIQGAICLSYTILQKFISDTQNGIKTNTEKWRNETVESIIGLTYSNLRQVLDRLESEGLIKQTRQYKRFKTK